jgi:nucleoside-diphosphate-sugar epimerase
MRVVLVTGATGFIGSALRKALQDHELGKTHRFVFLSSRAIDGCDTLIDKRDANGRY